MMGYGGFGGMMSGVGFWGSLYGLVVLIDLILIGIWLVKQTQKSRQVKTTYNYFSFSAIVIGLALFLSSSTTTVQATVMVGDVASYGKTYINYFMNHNYIEADKSYLYTYSVKTLESVRRELVRAGKIQDLWVVFEIPSSVFQLESDTTVIKKSATCALGYGDTVGNPLPPQLGECYSIYFVDPPAYQNLLSALLALSQLTDQNTPLVLETLPVVANAPAGPTFYSRPVWSPDSRFVAFGAWKDGQTNYEIYSIEKDAYLATYALSQGVAAESVWSHDSRYLAFASLSEVKIFDTQTSKTDSLDISGQTGGKNLQTLLSYDTVENKFLYAFDKNLLFDYDIYEHDPLTAKSTIRVQGIDYLSWGHPGNTDFKQVTSPDGRFEAKVVDAVTGSIKGVDRLAPSVPPPAIKNQASSSTRPVLEVVGSILLFTAGLILGKQLQKKQPSA